MKLTFLKTIFFAFLILPMPIIGGGKITLHTPTFVQNGNQFELVFLHKVETDSNLQYEISLSLTQPLPFGRCELVSPSKTEKISFKQTYDENRFNSVFKSSFKPKELGLKSGESFQIIIRLTANNSTGVLINSRFKVFSKDTLLNHFPKIEEGESNFHKSEIRFYQPEAKAGKNLLLKNSSYFNFSLNQESEKLMIESWLKFEGKDFSFFNIIDQVKYDTLIQFSISEFKHLLISNDVEIGYYESKYIGSKTWYHFMAVLNFKNNRIDIFVDNHLVAITSLHNLTSVKKLLFSFFNEKEKTKSNIENLKIWELKNEPDFVYLQRNFAHVKEDSSSLLRIMQFEDQDEFTIDRAASFNFENLNLMRSDAPIFAQAPEILVQQTASGYLIKWSGGDFSQSEKYIVERSIDGEDFKEIYSTPIAESSEQEEFSFLSEFIPENKFVYFRVKQINKDGSITYSQSLKIGQGVVENFEIKQNFPNPFNPKTSIKILILSETEIEITIYNLSGRHIADLFKGTLKKGEHSFEFDGTELPSGLYLYMVKTPVQSESRKMILAK